ncbi:MAG: ATP-binding protein [Pseudobacteriovorax sp.]|nr:ATP-binding protein [Pseudobacteriovorax sp.]
MTDTLTIDLKKLRLNYLSENFGEFAAGCDKEKQTAKTVIEKMVSLELVEKDRRSTDRRLKAAKLGKLKQLHHFDWAWPKSIDRAKIESLLEANFITSSRNVLIAGAQGLGKSMIAKNIGYHAVMKGYNVLFTTASELVMTLQAKESPAELNKALKRYCAPDLLIIDELGYLSYDCAAADTIFEVVNRRYENGSIIFTTNLAFKDWNKIFPGAACLTAMIDRITHHLELIKIEGDSYRLMESKKR